MTTHLVESNDSDELLAAEAVDQLHHFDDRRDAAEMRVEELVRDAEYEEPSHRQDSRVTPWLIFGVAAALLALGLGYFWIRTMCV